MRVRIFPLIVSVMFACGPEPDPVIPPSGLVYTPGELSVTTGQSGASSIPVFSGTTPVQFSISVNPASAAISIGSDGIISVSSSIQAGIYKVSVTLTNKAGSVSFSNAFTITAVDPILPPSALSYSPATAEVVQGTAFTGTPPLTTGTAPFTYSITTVPSTNQISISNTGVISSTTALGSGVYSITVSASNSAGSKSFSNAFTLTVATAAVAPAGLAYSPSSISITSTVGGTSSLPSITGTTPLTYSLTTTPDNGGKVGIDASGRIVISESMAEGTYKVNVRVSNAAGSVDFPNVFTITITSPPTSFSVDVRPILQANCASCHGWATDYQQVKNSVDQVLDRIQRPSGSAGFMPKGGTPLTAQQIALIQKWKDDGFAQ